MPSLTPSQRITLKADIAADPVLSLLPNTPDNVVAIAQAYALDASPDFWVWRTAVLESEYTREPSVDGTSWSWTAYIGRSQGERDAWARMFMGGLGGANPSLANVRQGFADIFSGAGGASQRAHLLAQGPPWREAVRRRHRLHGQPGSHVL
jgi:hypothetical protein